MLGPKPRGLLLFAALLVALLSAGVDRGQATPAETVARAVRVAVGGEYTCALTDLGDVRCWGRNSDGQLGDGSTESRGIAVEVKGLDSPASQLTAGHNFTCALQTNGNAACWGSNASSQLGAATSDRCEDFACSTTPVEVTGLGDVTSIAAGFGHGCAVTTGGALKCWGLNLYGQLGDGSLVDRLAPVTVSGLAQGVAAVAPGDVQTCALMDDTTVRCWGNNLLGELGDGTVDTSLSPVAVCGDATCAEPLSDVLQVSSGDYHTCAVTNAGAVLCWGSNAHGQLGSATSNQCGSACSSTPAHISGLPGTATAVTSSAASTCALLTSRAVYCWGLQFGAANIWHTPTRIDGWESDIDAAAAAAGHACAIEGDGEVSCLGRNTSGQLGDGTRADIVGGPAARVWLLSGRGDADCDAAISSLDAVLVLQLVAQLIGQLPCPNATAVDGQHAGSLDALAILQFSAGLLA